MTHDEEDLLRRAIELAGQARAAGNPRQEGPALFDEARIPVDGYYR